MENSDVVLPQEVDFFIQSFRKFQISEIGSSSWLEHHERLLKLSQQAVIEAHCHREEVVKELMVSHCKLGLLVHEAFCVLVWRNKVLSKLLAKATPKATFLVYSVLYHEATSVSFLETLLYHQNSCEALGDSALDLIDYCATAVSQLVGLVASGFHGEENADVMTEKPEEEVQRQGKDLAFQVGMKCVTILSYLVDKVDSLPLSARSRLVQVHDVPCLVAQVLEERPWLRRRKKTFEKYIDEKWQKVSGDDVLRVTKVEAQTWFCLRQLVFNPALMETYEITEFRQRELGKLSGLLNEVILDQLPCLAELKQCLCTLQVGGHSTKSRAGLVLEEIPEVKDKILAEAKQFGWKRLLAEHQKLFFEADQHELMDIARRLSEAYGSDLLAEIDSAPKETHLCGSCGKAAEKKCSRCQQVYYCSVECQKADWLQHREACKTTSA